MGYEIGPRLRKYREKQEISQKEFAKLIGVSNSRVSNWEQGINRPDVDILSKICEVLKVSPSELLGIKNCFNTEDGYNEKRNLSRTEISLLDTFNKLNDVGQQEAIKRVEELTYINKYTSSEIEGKILA